MVCLTAEDIQQGMLKMKTRFCENYLLVLVCVTLVNLILTCPALASDFEFVTETAVSPVPPPPPFGISGIARVDDQWFVSNLDSGWNVYDQNFNQVGTTTTSPSMGAVHGLAFDSNAGTVFLTSGNTIYECNTDGTVLNSFPSTGTALTSISFNPDNDHLFAVHFLGYVAELTRNGSFIGSFSLSGDYWSGSVYDAGQGTLLLMTDSDQVAEYMTDGTLVGMPLSADCVSGNGLGLAYDANTGFLTATGQFGSVGIWQRQPVVEIEKTTWDMVKSLYQ